MRKAKTRPEAFIPEVTLERAKRMFDRAVASLRAIPPGFTLYVANDTLCLMRGESHDESGRPRQDAVVRSDGGLRISGGDW